jgi:AraC-like DNA-binding protein
MTATYYGEFEPDARLKTWVACYWEFRVPEGVPAFEHTVPPDGGVSWSCKLPEGLMLFNGPLLVPLQPQLDGGDHFWGVRLWPGASPAFFVTAPVELRNRLGPARQCVDAPWIDELAPRLATCREQDTAGGVLDRALLARLDAPPTLDPLVMDAVFAILRANGEISVLQLAGTLGISERQLRRRFKAAVGLTPKELARIRRVRASIISALRRRTDPWIELACAHGYADQAHLTREFRSLAGLPPQQLKTYLSTIEHGSYQHDHSADPQR